MGSSGGSINLREELWIREVESGLLQLVDKIGKVFPGGPALEMAKAYIKGLLAPIERKNGWQMSEYLGRKTPYAIQQFLYRGRFSPDALRDCLRGYVA
jgi:SRSO17 transposase